MADAVTHGKRAIKSLGKFVEDHWVYIVIGIGIIVLMLVAHNQNMAAQQQGQGPNQPLPNLGGNQGFGGGGGGGGNRRSNGFWQRFTRRQGHWAGTGKNRRWVAAVTGERWV